MTVVLISLAISVVVFFKHRYTYWKKKGVEEYGTPRIPFGCIQDIISQKTILPVFLRDIYDYGKSKGLKYIGYYFFGSPMLVLTDLDLIRRVLQIDADVFLNRGFYINEKDDPLSGHVFALDGEKWKTIRQKVTQTFTTGQLKIMFQTMAATSVKLEAVMKHFCEGEPLDVRQIVSRFTSDVIASSGFGIEYNSLIEGTESEFLHYGYKVFSPSPSPWLFLKLFSIKMLPHSILRFAGVTVFEKGIRNFFTRIVRETVSYREENDVYRKDFLHLLIQLKNRGKLVNDGKVKGEMEGPGSITLNELTAQVFVYFLGGFETSASGTSYALYSLAANQDVQNRARDEIIKTLENYDGVLCYDAVADMTYLQQIVEGKIMPNLSFNNIPAKCITSLVVVRFFLLVNAKINIDKCINLKNNV